MYAVELVNVSKFFASSQQREHLAVKNLNLKVAEGEFFSFLGPSGCGKTTTLRMIAGFELPSSGEIYIHDRAMGKLPPFHRPVNTVFQNYALFPHLTVAENISFGLEMENLPRSVIRSHVADILDIVQLNGFEKRYPRQLSGGQQQRVALGRALVKKPQVLLLDEPLGALDLKLRKEMQLELKHMQQKVGITFIYVTHDQEEALTMSDRMAVMNEGKILQVGNPREIYEEPHSRFVADFIGETNLLSGRVIERKGEEYTILVDEMLLVQVYDPNPLPVGLNITLIIRPEKGVLFPVSADEPGYIGTIEETVYIGTDTRYLIRLTEQSVITIREQNFHHQATDWYQIGDTVKVKIPSDSIRTIQE